MKKYVLRFVYSFMFRWFLKIIVGVKFDKNDFLKDLDQFVIVANHNSHLDTITLLASLPSKILHKVKPIAAGDYFGRNWFTQNLSSFFINAVLIDRKGMKENPENAPIPRMISELEMGNSLILFPEGTRGEPEELKPFKRGIALVLAKKSEVPYVPAFMSGMGKNLPKGGVIPVPFNSYIKFGQPTLVDSDDTKQIISRIQNDILQLRTE